MLYFTGDWHLGQPKRKFKEVATPYKSPREMQESLIENTLATVTKYDTLFIVGDFIDCRSDGTFANDFDKIMTIPRQFPCRTVLIIGNNEWRFINEVFNGDFSKFRNFCLECGWHNVMTRKVLVQRGRKYVVVHRPDNVSDFVPCIFAHFHLAGPLLKRGYNVTCYCNFMRPVSFEYILKVLKDADTYWTLPEWDRTLGVRSW